MNVVVDTSIWVEYFRGTGAGALDSLLEDGRVLLVPVVAAELLSAPLSPRERAAIRRVLEDLPLHPTPLEHWCSVGELRAKCRRLGLSVSTPDAHVAQCAFDAQAELWSGDAIFSQMAQKIGLQVFKS
ncbi:MAG: PIN domain-containing protein [Polyangiaceae bacterium]|nr:PIN domain-containing protein [Polyangiaceae bacterium]